MTKPVTLKDLRESETLVIYHDNCPEAWTDYEAQANDVERSIDAFRSAWRKRFEECLRLPLLIIGATLKDTKP